MTVQRLVLTQALVLCVVFCLTSVFAQTQWRYNEINPDTTPQGHFAGVFAEYLNELSDGRIQMEVFYSATLVGYEIAPVQTGVVTFNQLVPSAVSDLYAPLSVLDAPYIYRDFDHMLAVTDPSSPILEELNEGLAPQGVRLLIGVPIGTRHITANRPIYNPDDLQGLTIRVVPSQVYIETLRAAGASPTPMPFPEVPTALATGVIDGQENPYSVIVPHRLYEVQDYVVLTGHLETLGGIFMNQDAWEALSEEDRELVRQAARQARDDAMAWLHEREEEWLATLEEAGTTIIGPDDGLDIDAFVERIAGTVRQHFDADWGDLYDRIRNYE